MSGHTYSFMYVKASLVNDLGNSFNVGFGASTGEEGVTVVFQDDVNAMTVGSDGDYMHSLHAGQAGQVTIHLLKISPMNKVLEDEYNRQRQSATTWGKNSMRVTNLGGNDVISCEGMAFKKAPDLHYAKDGDILQWVFDAGKIHRDLGTY